MANFEKCIKPILAVEAGYCIDSGGETWRGVARKFWPHWAGWKIVDENKGKWPAGDWKAATAILSKIPQLQALVLSFYKENFWEPIDGDDIEDDTIATILCDSAVNEGIKPALDRAMQVLDIKDKTKLTQKLNAL